MPKQTQGATFGEKVNAGLHATGGALAQGVGLRFRPAFFDIFTEFNDLRPHPGSSSSSSAAAGASGFTPGSGISINPGRAADVLAHEAAHVAQQRGGVSNVLKTKHDTAKNSINNVR